MNLLRIALAFAATVQWSTAQEPENNGFEQNPTIAPSSNNREPHGQAEPDNPLAQGPTPKWIWGAEANSEYRLERAFQSTAKRARLVATCDNRMTITINGKQVAASSSWESPVTLDVGKYLSAGDNSISATVANAGGPSGFILKLALLDEQARPTYLISDESWSAVLKSKDSATPVRVLGKLGDGPWGNVFNDAAAQGRNVFNLLPGFQAELLFTVPKETLGSWVSIAFDDKGRLLASDQGGKGICRITVPRIGSDQPTKVEKLDIAISSAHGMLYAFDSLYLSVNGGPGSGLYRAIDTDGDDQFDQLKKLKALRGGGEHGPHALRLSPDGESIYLICGNHTDPPADFAASRIPSNWSEDLLLPRQWDANGHARGKLAPGGWIARTDPDGKHWEIISVGYRNPYDMDFNADGELFAYDADMEWDMGTPWYRPTRVVHVTSGSEFGWRSGTGKWPNYFPDSLPQLIDIGPGSPVGVCFGYGTRFPEKYQQALYLCDWTFGTMYAIHISPSGSSYQAKKEEFLSRTPLPLTDVAVGPDGALYFTIGGRGTQSELYRVVYTGKGATVKAAADNSQGRELRNLRSQLEQLHGPTADPAEAISLAWEHLNHDDRNVSYAARIALEHQPIDQWVKLVTNGSDRRKAIHGAIALARQGTPALKAKTLASLDTIRPAELQVEEQLDYLRALALAFIRLGSATERESGYWSARLLDLYPAEDKALNRELCRMLVYLKEPQVIARTIELMKRPPVLGKEQMDRLLERNKGYGGTIANMLSNQVDQQKLHYAFVLRNLNEGWTLDQRKYFFDWLTEARGKNGGASYRGFINNIDNEAYANASEQERLAIEATGARRPYEIPELPKPHGPGRDWSADELRELVAQDALNGRNFKNGKRMFAAARCVICHRFAGDGGATGPDLTQAAGRFNPKDLIEAIVLPSRVISDQYKATSILTVDGQVIAGRIVSEDQNSVSILSDPEKPTSLRTVSRDDIEQSVPSQKSIMPEDLIDQLNQGEVLDLLAYLLSRGNARDPMFKK